MQGVSHCGDAQSAPGSWQLAPLERLPACGVTCACKQQILRTLSLQHSCLGRSHSLLTQLHFMAVHGSLLSEDSGNYT